MAYQLYYAVIDFIQLRTDFGEYCKLTQKQNNLKVHEFTLYFSFRDRIWLKKLAFILFAIFLTEGNDFSFFLLPT